jgi:hypothetical protein
MPVAGTPLALTHSNRTLSTAVNVKFVNNFVTASPRNAVAARSLSSAHVELSKTNANWISTVIIKE